MAVINNRMEFTRRRCDVQGQFSQRCEVGSSARPFGLPLMVVDASVSGVTRSGKDLLRWFEQESGMREPGGSALSCFGGYGQKGRCCFMLEVPFDRSPLAAVPGDEPNPLVSYHMPRFPSVSSRWNATDSARDCGCPKSTQAVGTG